MATGNLEWCGGVTKILAIGGVVDTVASPPSPPVRAAFLGCRAPAGSCSTPTRTTAALGTQRLAAVALQQLVAVDPAELLGGLVGPRRWATRGA